MVDLPISSEMSNEEAGRVVVDWAKRVLKHYEGSDLEPELLGHHSLLQEVPQDYFHYQLPETVLAEFSSARSSPNWPLIMQINVRTLERIAFNNWGTKVN